MLATLTITALLLPALLLPTLLLLPAQLHAAPIAIASIERAEPVDFQRDIVPILQKKCLACHSASERQGELILESPATILKGGDTGAAVVAGKSAESLLLRLASHEQEPLMPPPDNDVAAAPLTSQELGLIRLWIDQGAKGNSQNAALSPTKWRSLPRGVNPIYAVGVTPDGQYAACSRANQIFIYHVPTGQLITRLTDPALQARDGDFRPGIAHLDLVQSLAFNRDGDMLASGGFRTVKLWRRPRDVVRLKLAAATEAVNAVAISPDRSTLALGAGNEVKLWELASGKLAQTLAGHEAAVTGLRFSLDGTHLYSSSLDKTVRRWSLADGQLVGRLDVPHPINALELVAGAPADSGAKAENDTSADEPDTTWVAIGDAEKLIRLYHPPTSPVALSDALANPAAMATTIDHTRIAVASGDGSVRVQDAAGKIISEWKNGSPVTALAFHPLATPDTVTPDTQQPVLATAAADGVVRLWNYETAEPINALQGSKAAIGTVAFRTDGKQLVSGDAGGAITVWNLEVEPGAAVQGCVAQPASVAALSPDGKRLATAGISSGRPAIVILDLEANQISHTLLGHDGPIRALAFSADGARLVSGSADKSSRIWDLGDSKFPELARFNGHGGEVTAVAFNSNATQVLSGSADKTLKLWNAVDAAEIKDFAGHTAAIVGVAFDSSNQPISASADKTIRTWNAGNGQQVRAISDPQVLTASAISRDRTRIAVAGADQAVRVYQLNNGQTLATMEGHSAAITGLDFSADAARIVSTTAGQASVWEAATGRLLEVVPVTDLATSTFVSDANTLMTITSAQIDRRTLRFAQALTGLTKAATSVAFHPDGQAVYASSLDGTLRGFNVTNGQPSFSANHGAPIHDAALSPDGQFLVTAGEDKVIKVWNASNGQPAQPALLPGFDAPVHAVAFSADGTRVIGGTSAPAHQVLAFEFATRTLEQSFVGHTSALLAIEALDRENFATLSADGAMRRWSLAAIKTLAAHTQAVTSLAVLPTDRQQVFSASLDGTIRHWNTATAQQVRQLNHGGPIESIAVRPDGLRLASASSNHSIRLWNAQNGQQMAEMRGDLRAKTIVTRLTQEQTAATAKRDAAKRDWEAAEKDLPVKTEAAKKEGEALATANKDVEEKTAAVKKAEAEKVAAEKLAIEAAAAAQQAAVAKAEADTLAVETARLATLAAARAQRFATLLQQDPEDQKLAAAKADADKQAAAAADKAAQAKAAQAAPAKALDDTTNAATDAAAKVTATQKPYNDAMAALRPALATQNTAAQLSAIAARELEEAKALVPMSKTILDAAESELAAAQKAVEAAKEASAAAEQPLRAVAFSPDGQRLVSGGDLPVVHSWDAETGTAIASYVGHQAAVRCLAFVSDEELISGSDDKTALAWELNPAWELARTIGDVKDPSQLVNRVLALDFNRDGTRLATGSGEPSRSGEVKIWNVADGALVQAIDNAHDDTVHGVRFSPDDKVIASCGADKYVRTFDAASGKLLRRFEGHTHHVLSVAWQGDGQVLASAGADHVVKIWNANTADQTRTIAGFNKQVTSLQFIGDTPDIATTSGDKIVRFVRSTNGGTVRNFGGAADFMHSIDITPDGAILVAGGHDSVLRIWNGTNGQVLKNLEPPEPEATADAAEQGSEQVAGN